MLAFFAFLGMTLISSNLKEKRTAEMIQSGQLVRSSMSSKDYEGMNYNEAYRIIQKDGFTEISLVSEDTTFFNRSDAGTVKSVKINGSNISASSTYDPNAVVVVTYYKTDQLLDYIVKLFAKYRVEKFLGGFL